MSISWYSKKQNTVETITFGSKFIALRINAEKSKGLGYNLMLMDMPLNGLSNVYVDELVSKTGDIPCRQHMSIVIY